MPPGETICAVCDSQVSMMKTVKREREIENGVQKRESRSADRCALPPAGPVPGKTSGKARKARGRTGLHVPDAAPSARDRTLQMAHQFW